jgi:AraC-like DNA-binding protein
LPSDVLSGLVDSLFYWDGLPMLPRERTFPNGLASLYVQLDDPYRPGDGPSRDEYPALCADGLLTRPLVVEAPRRRARVIGVKLTPVGAVRIFDTALGEFGSGTHDLEDVVGNAARELGGRAAAALNARAAVAVTVAWLRERVARSREVAADVLWITRQIEAANGVLSTRGVMESCTASPSRLSGAFRNYFGLSPKRFARVVRFRRALDILANERAQLADVAGRCGYYDQSHFNAEFKLHAGMTPRAFLAARRYPGSASLAEL